MHFSRTAFWMGWYHWYIGFGLHRIRRGQPDGLPVWQIFVGLGHTWAPRYCITWIGPFSYWHMHNAEEIETTSGWGTTFERFNREGHL
jgi:hypothetical protein